MQTLKKWSHDLLYQNDGTMDLSRVLMALMALSYIGQSIWAIHHGQVFDWQSFGIGAGAVLGGGGAGVMWHGRAA